MPNQFYVYPHTDLNQQNLDWIIATLKDLQNQIAQGAAGVEVITTSADMNDPNVIYIYRGSEAGYNYNHWYYWDAGITSWVDGGYWGFDSSLLPISIDNGGTGSTTAADARTALGITPANIGAVPASDLPLSIANGGTASITASDARTALGITPANIGAVATSALPLSIANGGTGAVDKASARTSLEITPANIGIGVYITETSTEDGWFCRKYSDGYRECFKQVSVTDTFTTPKNAPFYVADSDAWSTHNYPASFFSNAPYVFITGIFSTTWNFAFPTIGENTAAAVKIIDALAGQAVSATTVSYTVYAFGK